MPPHSEQKNNVSEKEESKPDLPGRQMTATDRRRLYMLLDLLLSLTGALLALLAWNIVATQPISVSWCLEHAHWIPILSSGTLLTFALSGCYMMSSAINFRTTFSQVIRALSVLLVGYYTVYFFAPRQALPRLVVLFYVLLSFPLFVMARRLVSWFSVQPEVQQNVILLGNTDSLIALQKLLSDHTMTDLRLVGLFPTQASEREGQDKHNSTERFDESVKRLDPDRTLLRYAERYNAGSMVLFEEPDKCSDDLLNQLVDCHQKGITITSGLELIEELSGRLPLSYARQQPNRLFPSRRNEGLFYRALKRSMDLFGSLFGLLLFLPFLPFIAAGIKLSSTGPVFFRQERTGQYGEPFELVKLRTMVENAEEETGAQWAEKDDPRITSFGKFLRLTHLDEFPQFWNVLKGDMSLVGPRPERPEIEEKLTDPNPFFKLRHSVKPGVTGWATIKNQYVDSLEKAERRLEYDLYYIEHQSVWLDLHILFETFWELISFGGR